MESNIGDLLYAIGIIVVGLGSLFVNYGSFTKTVVRWAKPPVRSKKSNKLKQPPLSMKETLLCYLPFYQVCYTRKSLYKSYGFTKIMAIISMTCIGCNLFNKFVFAVNGYVMFFFNIAMYIGVILCWLLYAIVTADCAHMYGFSWFTILLCFLFPHLFCWYLHNNIPTKMRQIHREETFSEHNGNTVIKQRPNK